MGGGASTDAAAEFKIEREAAAAGVSVAEYKKQQAAKAAAEPKKDWRNQGGGPPPVSAEASGSGSSASSTDSGESQDAEQPKAAAKAKAKPKPKQKPGESDEAFNTRMKKYEGDFRGKSNLHDRPDAPNFAPVVQMLDRSIQMMLRETSKMRQPSKQEEMFKKQQQLLQVTADIRHLAKNWKLAGKEDLDTVLNSLKDARQKLRGFGLTVEISDSTNSEDRDETIEELQAARRTMQNMQETRGVNPYTGRSDFNTGANSFSAAGFDTRLY